MIYLDEESELYDNQSKREVPAEKLMPLQKSMKFLRRIYAIKRWLFRPAILRNMVVEGTHSPRTRSILPGDSRTFLLTEAGNLERTFEAIGKIWDKHWSSFFLPQHSILIKINLNTADPYPASTDPRMLEVLLRFLHKRNFRRLWVGDCSSVQSLPTRKVAAKTGIIEALSGMASFLSFDEGPWVSVPIPGHYLKEITVPRIALEADRIISLSNMKSHLESDFSFGMKLGIGFVHPLERFPMHRDHLREKIAEINLAVPPDLTIIDGRTAFITGGPNRGKTARCDAVIAGTDVVEADLTAYNVLFDAKRKNDQLGGFTEDPFGMVQFSHAKKLGLSESSMTRATTVSLQDA